MRRNRRIQPREYASTKESFKAEIRLYLFYKNMYNGAYEKLLYF